MRRGEILSLKWNQIKTGFIYITKTKTNEARQIPVNEALYGLFQRLKNEQNPKGMGGNVVGIDGEPVEGQPSEFVFTMHGKPLNRMEGAFNAAVRRAAISDFHFHDLRHTFASQLIMKGGTLKDVQELLGHKTMTMTLRYAHLSQEHKRQAVNLLNGLTGFGDCYKTVTVAVPTPKKHMSIQ